MERLWPTLRTVSLLAAGSLLVHELRYVAGYGSGAGEALAEQGHSYMPWLEAVVCVLVIAAVIRFAVAIARASRGEMPEPPVPRFMRAWCASSVVLAAIYAAQEGFEGTFAPGHPTGIVGVVGHGGWTALLFSVLVGALVAAVTKLAYHAVTRARARRPRLRQRRRARGSWPAAAVLCGRRLDVLACNLAGRAPPASS